jgi:hypothetical protein
MVKERLDVWEERVREKNDARSDLGEGRVFW